ncbi:agl cluster protein AglQ [Natrinema salsiterrestre]|uniref:Agl cluster protein AglQ n=1 Tax=Natrinema salsiterrestre TaxID=2950540 RepID=A0A9Q4Q1V3_9EURY|nr:agl cluster protein AglQ [Natrinema salsiterrestre]MDF9744107.1 agl cluster protein AglQ [Natrinema salsiterrestre]
MKANEFVERIAMDVVSEIDTNGSMPAGHNGLYQDPETSVRNTSHWLVAFSELYDRTGNSQFESAARSMAAFLQSDEARPEGETFHHRDIDGKDQCNGLIGQAWTIEALATAARVFEREELANLAQDVFLTHPQDERTGLWKRVEIDGRILPFDATFNHQIWFAAAGGLLADLPWTSPRVDDRVRTHLNELENNIRLYPNGLIFHPLKPPQSLRRYAHLVRTDERARIGLTLLTSSVPLPSRRRQLRWKAIGYHSFNLYAFALLKRQYPDHSFWESEPCRRALNYLTSSAYTDNIWENEYGSPYNPVGFEVPFVMEVFDIGSATDRSRWISEQLDRHYNSETNRLDRNTEDEATLTARVYQASRLNETRIDGCGENGG